MDRYDALAIFGAALVIAGCALINGPLGLITTGACLICLASLGASRASGPHAADRNVPPAASPDRDVNRMAYRRAD